MIINKVIRETALSNTTIKRFGSGSLHTLNALDVERDGITAAEKYPVIWLHDVQIKIMPDAGMSCRYLCRIVVAKSIPSQDETEDNVRDTLETTAQLAKQFCKSLTLHPAVRDDDKMPISFDLFEIPFQLDDVVAGWEIHCGLFLKEPGITCTTPTTTLEYYNGGYVVAGYV